jgi:hypothetical protein
LANLQRKAGLGAIVANDLRDAILLECSRAFHTDAAYTRKSLKKLWIEHELPGEENVDKILAVSQEDFDISKKTGRKRLMAAVDSMGEMESALFKKFKKRRKEVFFKQ